MKSSYLVFVEARQLLLSYIFVKSHGGISCLYDDIWFSIPFLIANSNGYPQRRNIELYKSLYRSRRVDDVESLGHSYWEETL